jgi:hypothetical protein
MDDSFILGGNTERILSVLRLAGADTNRFITEDFVSGERSIRQRPFLLIFLLGLASVLICCEYILRETSEFFYRKKFS